MLFNFKPKFTHLCNLLHGAANGVGLVHLDHHLNRELYQVCRISLYPLKCSHIFLSLQMYDYDQYFHDFNDFLI